SPGTAASPGDLRGADQPRRALAGHAGDLLLAGLLCGRRGRRPLRLPGSRADDRPPAAARRAGRAGPARAAAVPGGAARRRARRAAARATPPATHRGPRGSTSRGPAAPAAATCRPTWRDVRYRYRGTLRLTFGNAITATFRGTRVPRHHGHARAVTWAASF